MGINELEQLTNEQVGAATKALLLTWLISADSMNTGDDADRETKLEAGVLDLLIAQANDRDLEVTFHSIGYAHGAWGGDHDRDTPETALEHAAIEAHRVVAAVVADIVERLHGRVSVR